MTRYFKIARRDDLEAKTGTPVLAIPASPVVAVAHTTSPRARHWDIIDVDAGEHLTSALGVAEARTVLVGHARARDVAPTGRWLS